MSDLKQQLRGYGAYLDDLVADELPTEAESVIARRMSVGVEDLRPSAARDAPWWTGRRMLGVRALVAGIAVVALTSLAAVLIAGDQSTTPQHSSNTGIIRVRLATIPAAVSARHLPGTP